MTRTEVLNRLKAIFESVFVQPIAWSDRLSAADVSEWDSLSHITLVSAIEKRFGIRFIVGEVESTRNTGELADLIIRRIETTP